MLPSRATIHACPVAWEQGRAQHVNCWKNCYGLDLRLLGERRLASMAGKPLVEDVTSDDLLCEPLLICDLDLYTVTVDDLAVIERPLAFRCTKAGAQLAGVALWFDCFFGERSAGGAAMGGTVAPTCTFPKFHRCA